MKYLPLILILVTSLCFADIERKNIVVDKNYRADGIRFFMCNLYSKTPKTQLPKVKNCTFERCNLYGTEIDETNTLIRSNIVDTTPPPVYTVEQLKTKKAQLESEITASNKKIPKEYYERWIEKLESIINEEDIISP